MHVKRYLNRHFNIHLAEDDGGGGGGGTEQVINVADFEPTGAAELEAMVNGIEPPAKPQAQQPAPEEKPKQEEPPKKHETQPEKKQEPAAKTRDKDPVHLRKEYEATKAERDTLKAQIAEMEKAVKENPEIASLRSELDSLKKERETLAKSAEDYERKLAMHDPLATRKMRELDDKFNTEIKNVFDLVPDLDGDYVGLVRQFASLPRNSREEYNQSLKEFRDAIRDKYPDDFATVFDAVNKGYQHRIESAKLADQLRTDSSRFHHEERLKLWEGGVKGLEEDAKTFFEVPEDIAESDPHNPVLFLKTIRESLPEDKQAAFDKQQQQTMAFVKRFMLGGRPKTAQDYPGMTPEQVAEAQAKESESLYGERKAGARMLAQGIMLLANLRPFLADYTKMQARLAELAQQQPPDPTGSGESNRHTDSSTDLSKWEPPKPVEI